MEVAQFTQIPPQVRAVMYFLAGGSIVSVLFAFDRKLGAIALAGLFMMVMTLAVYKRIIKWRQQKQAKTMSGQIQDNSASAPSGISDPAKRARLDDLKRSFGAGMEKFQSTGKDVYKLPWYLIVGEPGSGKTEAVRRCNVGFPPGLQDELQGVGGTINMNWWFTNHAVMLDTAGRLMFEEVKPGETSEWREFLQLLRRNRPNCPVNGLLLVIPAESLIRDTTEEITRKAGKIASQLDLIQRSLDVRFPVFILVTKCDLLSGFREFFEGLKEPQTQHQMIGWSNPDPRDAPFRPELVTDHLTTVVERIRKRRLGLLRDPVPEKEGGKRADEVDALYGLPQSLSLVAPRLRSYLEKIFVAGEWSAKPLFLRGIYFTSAMREGAALDQELAQALGVSLDDLPEGRAWERERAYFLRDLFMEKAFREKGLVTRATNTKALLRQRQFLLYGVGAFALFGLLGFSFFGYMSLKQSIGQQSSYWSRAKQGWNNGTWHPIIERDALGKVRYVGDNPAFPDDNKTTLTQYHGKIRELCDKPIEIGWIFKPIAGISSFEGDRRKAQRILLEGGVISPIINEARREMTNPAKDAALPADVGGAMLHEAEALVGLIRVESDSVSHKKDATDVPDKLLLPLIGYSTGGEKQPDPANYRELANTIIWTYSQNKNGVWPPPWLSAGGSLATNKPIQTGVDRLIRYANESTKGSEANLDYLKKIRDLLRAFRQKETDLNNTAVSAEDRNQVYLRMNQLHDELKTAKEALDQGLKDAESRHLVASGPFTIGGAYDRLIGASATASKEAFDLVEKSVADYAAKPTDSVNTNYPLFVQIDARLKEVQTDITRRIAQGFSDQEQQELKALDQSLLADFGGGKRLYEVRWSSYDLAQKQLFNNPAKEGLIGTKWAAYTVAKSENDRQRQGLLALKDKVLDPFTAAWKYFLDRALEIQTDQVLKSYTDQTRSAFDSHFHYPLVKEGGGHSMGKKDWNDAERLLGQWKGDLNAEAFQQMNSPRKEKLVSFLSAVEPVGRVIPSLNGSVTVGIVPYSQTSDKQGLNHFRKVLVRGHEYDTSTDHIYTNYSFLDTFSAEFLDYSVTPRKTAGYSSGVMELLNRAHGGGHVTISVDGFSIALEVRADRPPPDLGSLPDKQRIASTLN